MFLRRRFLFSFVLVAALAGCAEERATIDRTQPNALEKSLFQGEWYYQQTVVDIPGTWSFTFIGETNWAGMERIRWDVQENWLYARRAYERIANAEVNGGDAVTADPTPTGEPYLGAILAAYPITSHFDIRRAYNSVTGEEMNVLEENSSDRFWWEREYFRVDWSKNYATEFMFLVDDVAQDPVNYYIQDENDPDHMVIEEGQELAAGGGYVDGREPYIDITNVMMVRPGMTYFEDIGESYPTCWLFSRATSDCTTEPVKIRSSFLRLNPADEFDPKPYKGLVTEYFGLFTADRLVFDPEREVNHRLSESYANLHNLWKGWFNADGTLRPPAQRTLNPMIYYAHNWPENLDQTMRDVETEWNTIFQRAASAATDTTVTDKVFILCHTPVDTARGDDPRCTPSWYTGTEPFSVRLGDVRYSWLAYMPKYYDGFALLGLGPSNTDPVTGEIFSAGAYLYIYNDVVVQSTIDQIQLLNGDLPVSEWIDGLDIQDWAGLMSKQNGTPRTFSQDEIAGFAGVQKLDWMNKVSLPAGRGTLPAELNGKSAREVLDKSLGKLYNAGAFNGVYDTTDARMRSIRDTYIEDLLINPEIQLAAGIMPGTPLSAFSEEMLRDASVARLGPIAVMRAAQAKKDYWANVKEVDLMNTADDGYWGLAQQFAGQSQDAIRPTIADRVFHAVTAHELGHSFNLHHNFGGTEDVVNYPEEYWNLRTHGGTLATVLPRFVPGGEITTAELEGNIYRYAYSSIMDYSRLTLDYGPGKYDSAAILLGYANHVEAFNSTGTIGDPEVFAQWANSDGSVLSFYLPPTGPKAFHYTEWWNQMGDLLYLPSNRSLVDANDVDWSSPYAGTSIRVPYIFCSPYQSDIGNNCFTRDYGADEFERMDHHVRNAKTWYISRAFTRYAVGATPEDYVGRTYERMYQRLKGYNDYHALMGGILYMYYPKSIIDSFLSDPIEGWGAYTIAQRDAVNFLLQTLAMPNTGEFEPTEDGAGETYLGEAVFNTTARTNVVTGRYFETTWWNSAGDDSCGMNFWMCLHHYGYYLDKMMALEALTDSNTYFVARDTAADVRQWRISYWDNYSTVLNDFFGAALSQDMSAYAPRYSTPTSGVYGDVFMPDYAGASWFGAAPPAAQPIDPSTGFTVQIYLAVLGMAKFQNNFDKSFLDSTRMWLDGSGLDIDVTDTVDFVDPTTGKVYQAIDFPSNKGVAQRMIERANTVLARTTDAGLTAQQRETAQGELVRYQQLLDVMVDLTGYFETATQGYGDPWNPGQVPGGDNP